MSEGQKVGCSDGQMLRRSDAQMVRWSEAQMRNSYRNSDSMPISFTL